MWGFRPGCLRVTQVADTSPGSACVTWRVDNKQRAHRKVGSDHIRLTERELQEWHRHKQLDHHGVDDVDKEGAHHGHHQKR